MHLSTFESRIMSLTAEELRHAIQLSGDEVQGYKFIIRNYSSEKLTKYGVPYLKKLEERHQKFLNRLNEISPDG